MILAFADPSDAHTEVLARALADRGSPPLLFDLSSFPSRARLTLRDGDLAASELDVPGHGLLALSSVEAVWYRRPGRFEPAEAVRDADHREFAYEECYEAFAGMWQSLPVRWVNHPAREPVAAHKTWQLALARRLGLSIPRTCVTNDPAAARALVAELGGRPVVFKALAATPATWRPTRRISATELARLDLVRHAPVIFQEYVPGVDLRVTVVGDALLAAEIDARATASPHDFRLAFEEARVAPGSLPSGVAARLRALVAELGLAYAAIDLRRRDDGEHVFLEANPAGQWLFVERRTGLPITAALADLLVGR